MPNQPNLFFDNAPDSDRVTDPVEAFAMAVEGGGTSIDAGLRGGQWCYRSRSSSIALDDNDIDVVESHTSGWWDSIDQVMPEKWWMIGLVYVHPHFQEQVAQWYEKAYSELSDADRDNHNESRARDWQRKLGIQIEVGPRHPGATFRISRGPGFP